MKVVIRKQAGVPSAVLRKVRREARTTGFRGAEVKWAADGIAVGFFIPVPRCWPAACGA